MFRLKITRHKTECESFSMSHGGHIGVQVFQTSHVGLPKILRGLNSYSGTSI